MDDIDIDLPNARLAYTIIQSLLDAHEALSDLLVVMSHAIDEDVLKALTNTGEWEKYLESKRMLEGTRVQIEKFTEELKRLEKVLSPHHRCGSGRDRGRIRGEKARSEVPGYRKGPVGKYYLQLSRWSDCFLDSK